MMKILIVLDHPFPPHARVENEMRSLTEAGHEVHLACFQTNDEPLTEQLLYGTIHRRPVSKFIYKTSVGVLKFPFYFNYWRRFVNDLYDAEPFDAIHICDLPLARVGYEMKCKHGTRFVLDLFENWPVLLQLSTHTNTFLGKLLSTNSQWVAYEKEMCALADKIIVVVDEAKTRIESLGVPSEKIFVVSNTLNIDQFDPMERKGFSKDAFRLLYVGGINYHRGIQYVIKAISILKGKGIEVHFDLVGNGSYVPKIKEMIEELHVQDNVTVHGFKLFTQICDLYESAHVALIPHIKSGHTDNTIPHKIFQYMYAEIPMIVSNCDPLVRIVNETQSGVSYQYDQPEELAAIVADFYEHPEKLERYIQHGRQAVIDKYNWRVDGERLVGLYASFND
ncbi:MAG: glycosyltransferase family 4 protein [Bacteroidales bacterium]|nr:glycosyltransferase family 4 protein [Bacteroidales bacterium]